MLTSLTMFLMHLICSDVCFSPSLDSKYLSIFSVAFKSVDSTFFYRVAAFKHIPVAFFLIGASFMAAIGLNHFLETGTIQRLLGTYRGMESKDELRTEMATALLKSVSKISSCSFCCHLILTRLLPVIHTGLIAYKMSAFVEIQFDPFTLFHTQQTLYTSYMVPVQNRSDVLLDLFPRKTVYEFYQFGTSGTYFNVDVYCTQATASVLELTYLILLYIIVLFWYIMIIDKIVVSNYMLVYGCFYAKGSNLKFGSRILLFMIKKNIDNLLMEEILDLSYAENIQIA